MVRSQFNLYNEDGMELLNSKNITFGLVKSGKLTRYYNVFSDRFYQDYYRARGKSEFKVNSISQMIMQIKTDSLKFTEEGVLTPAFSNFAKLLYRYSMSGEFYIHDKRYTVGEGYYTYYIDVDIIDGKLYYPYVYVNQNYSPSIESAYFSVKGHISFMFSRSVKLSDSTCRFLFTSTRCLFDDELDRIQVYFFVPYSQPEKNVGMNIWSETGELIFSTRQPPMKMVSIERPILSELLKGGRKFFNDPKWQNSSSGERSFLYMQENRKYAVNLEISWDAGLSTIHHTGGKIGSMIDVTEQFIGCNGGVMAIARPTKTHELRTVFNESTSLSHFTFNCDGPRFYANYQDIINVVDVTHLPFPYN